MIVSQILVKGRPLGCPDAETTYDTGGPKLAPTRIACGNRIPMKRSRPFLNLMLADFIARSAYQMGKTPLLPIFAAAMGASGRLPGF